MSSQGTAVVVAFEQNPVVMTEVVVNTTKRPAVPKRIKKGGEYILYRDGTRIGLVTAFDIVKPSRDEFGGVWVSHDTRKSSLLGVMRYLKYVPGSTHPGFRADGDPCPEYIPGCARRSGHVYHLRPRRFWRR